MIIVGDILNNVKEILGGCSDEIAYNRLNEAQDVLGDLGIWEPSVGLMDICTCNCMLTLPDDVEVPLAINVGGTPCNFRNKWYEFHLNGPGSDCCNVAASYSWTDEGEFPTFRDVHRPSTLMAQATVAENPGAFIRVYGYDECGNWIMTPDCEQGGALVDGFCVPIIYPYSTPTTIKVKRIVRISKPVTVGFVKLFAMEPSSHSGSILLGYYKPSETNPSYRRITVSGCGCNWLKRCAPLQTWVRMRFRRKNYTINSPTDVIFLHSPTATT